MTSILDKQVRVSGLDYLFMFALLFYAGGASSFARSIGNILTIGNAFILLLTVVVLLQNRIRIKKDFLISCGVFLFYAAITTFINRMLNPLWISQWLVWLFITYVCCKNFRGRFFLVYETVMFWMTLIAMVFWMIQLAFPNQLESFIRSVSVFKSYSSDVDNANIVFYTIQDFKYVDIEFSGIMRNPGFAWEPGAFAVFLCFALFCNLLRTGWNLIRNWSLYVFLIALLSTQSTTGLSIFFLCLLVKLFIDKKILSGILAFVVLAVAFLRFPFMWPKIYEEIINIKNFTYEDISYGVQQLGRLRSLYLSMQDFKAHPFFGLGGYAEGTFLRSIGFDDVSIISGIGELLSKYGIIMTVLFLFSVVFSSKIISDQFRCKYAYTLIIVFIGMCISYSLWRTPLIMAFWLYGYYCQPERIRVRLNPAFYSQK